MLQFVTMNVTILSRQRTLYSTRRLVEALLHGGHQVRVQNPLLQHVVLNGHSTAHGELLPDAVIPRIGASITEFGCAVVRQFEQQDVWVLNSALSILRSRDKLLSMQLLHNNHIPMPRTAVVGQPQSLFQAIQLVGGLPVVLKIRRGTQGRGVVLVRTLSAARHAHAVLHDFQQVTLVQEYVAQARNRDVRIIVVGRQAIAAMERSAPPGDFRANLHRGGTARPFKMNDAIRELAVQAAEAHGLNFAGVDLLVSNRGPVVIEVNSSPGLQGIETTTGVRVAEAVATFVEQHHVRHPVKEQRWPTL